MKSNVKILITFLIVCSFSNVFGQNRTAIPCGKGLYPNGNNCYPCLGCHPCPGEKGVYCSDFNNTVVLNVSEMNSITLIQDFKVGKLKGLISEKDLKRLVLENSTQDSKSDGNIRAPRVKCKCGTDVYGKDDAACGRICDFLKDYGKL